MSRLDAGLGSGTPRSSGVAPKWPMIGVKLPNTRPEGAGDPLQDASK